MTEARDKTIGEIRSSQSKERQEVKKDAELFQQLTTHPAWVRYMALLETVGQNYHKTLMAPLNNSFECVKSEFAKGALTGLSLAAGLPSAKIREAEELTTTQGNDDDT